jgi:hypothetical protein
MKFYSFLFIVLLQFVAIFFSAVKILQEIFLTNPNFLSGISLSPLPVLVLSALLIGISLYKNVFSMSRLLGFGSLLLTLFLLLVSYQGNIFGWLLLLMALGCFLLLNFQLLLGAKNAAMRIIFTLLNVLLTAAVFIDWQIFYVTRAHLNSKILAVIFQEQKLLKQAATYFGVKEQALLLDLFLLIVLPLIAAWLLSRISHKTAGAVHHALTPPTVGPDVRPPKKSLADAIPIVGAGHRAGPLPGVDLPSSDSSAVIARPACSVSCSGSNSVIARLDRAIHKCSFPNKHFLVIALLLLIVHYCSFSFVCRSVPLANYISLRVSAGILPLPLHPQLAAAPGLKNLLNADHRVNVENLYQPPAIKWQRHNYDKIVFLMIESLRFDAFALLMPELNKLAGQGRLYANHYASANITLSSIYSLLHAGLPVNLLFSEHRNRQSSFEQAAVAAGYQTLLLKTDLVADIITFGQNEVVTTSKEAYETTAAVLDKTLAELQKPGRGIYLSYLFNMHFNYFYAPGFERFTPVCPKDTNIFVMPPTPANIEMIRNRYRNSALYADHCLAEFFKKVYANGLNEKTLFVIFGDHGQSLRERGSLGHGTGADELQYHVPVIFLGHNIEPSLVESPTSHQRLLAELADPAGFSFSSKIGAAQRGYPLLALEESVKGRILVIHQDYINIFDLGPGNNLRWIAILDRHYRLNPELIATFYLDLQRLQQAITSDLNFIKNQGT